MKFPFKGRVPVGQTAFCAGASIKPNATNHPPANIGSQNPEPDTSRPIGARHINQG